MLMLTIRCITKTRSFLSPLLFSNSFSSSSANLAFIPPSIQYQIENQSSESQEIVNSFRNWFRTSKKPLLERVFQILSAEDNEDLSSPQKVDLGLSQLGLRLSEEFVLEVLNYTKKDVLSCLKFFDWAGRQPAFHHTQATFIAIFKIFSHSKCTSLILNMLNTCANQKDLHRVRFNDILVIGYSLAGKVDIALQVFGKMRFNGVDLHGTAYHVLLNALVEERSFEAVDVLLEQIRLRGHETRVTHAITMKCLCKQDKLEEAENYLRELVSCGLVVSQYVLGTLVDALCKKNMFLQAANLIHEFEETGIVNMQGAYGVWIRDLVQAGKIEAALDFLQTKRSLEGYIPEVCRYNVLICRLLKENRLQEVCDLLMDMKESKTVPNDVTMNAAFCFFCKAGMMDVALELFKLNSEFGLTPGRLVQNYVIQALCGDGCTDEAYRVLKDLMNQGDFVDKKAFTMLANALCREGKLDKMNELVTLALERKPFVLADSMYEKFIRALCRARRVEDGYLLHGELNRLNRNTSGSTYACLIRGFYEASRGDIAARLLIEMQEQGHKPSKQLFRAVIECLCEMESPEKHFMQLLEMQLSRYGPNKGVFNFFIDGAGHAKRPDLAREVYEVMERTGIEPNLSSDILMMQCYLKNEKIVDALNWFDDLSKRRKIGRKIYNTVVVGFCKGGRAEFARVIIRHGRNNGVNLSFECYEELVKLYCSENRYDEAIKLINDMEKAGRKISSFIGNVFLLHSLKSRDLYRAWVRSRDVSDETPSTSMLGQLIAAFSGQIRADSKVEDLEQVIQKCFPLDLYSYNMLLKKLSIDQIDGACQIFNRLCQKGYVPNQWTYDILVRALFKHGRVAEAKLCAQEMFQRGYFPRESTKLLT